MKSVWLARRKMKSVTYKILSMISSIKKDKPLGLHPRGAKRGNFREGKRPISGPKTSDFCFMNLFSSELPPPSREAERSCLSCIARLTCTILALCLGSTTLGVACHV